MASEITLNAPLLGVNTVDDGRAEKMSLKDAAGKFEALMIEQMLKSARKVDSGGWTGESDGAGSTMMDMAEQQLAEAMGAQGGFGLANLVIKQVAGRK